MRQRTAFRCLFYGFGIMITTLMGVSMLDDNHLRHYCNEQDELSFDNCMDEYHKNYYYFVLMASAMGTFAIFILDVYFFWVDQRPEIEKIPATFCNNCGKQFESGQVWCGSKKCVELWREREI